MPVLLKSGGLPVVNFGGNFFSINLRKIRTIGSSAYWGPPRLQGLCRHFAKLYHILRSVTSSNTAFYRIRSAQAFVHCAHCCPPGPVDRRVPVPLRHRGLLLHQPPGGRRLRLRRPAVDGRARPDHDPRRRRRRGGSGCGRRPRRSGRSRGRETGGGGRRGGRGGQSGGGGRDGGPARCCARHISAGLTLWGWGLQ